MAPFIPPQIPATFNTSTISIPSVCQLQPRMEGLAILGEAQILLSIQTLSSSTGFLSEVPSMPM